VQETLHRLLAEVVVSQKSASDVCQIARANLEAIVGNEMEIVVSQVPAFAYDPASKFRSVQSLVSEPRLHLSA
jgi:hypothetical protein